MNLINMNLLQAIFINIFILCLDTSAVSQGVAENVTLKKDVSRKNHTANDLILQLSKLISSNINPRQRFPPNVYNDYPSDSYPQYPSYDEYPDPNEQYYDSPGQYGQINYPIRPYPYKRRPQKYRYPPFSQYPIQDSQFPGGFNPFQQRPGPFGPGQFGPGPFGPGPFGPGPFNPYQEGPLDSLTRALSSIARYDDQQCVPRLLCEVAAGGNPSGKQSSFIPSFLSMDSLFTLLSAFANEQVSPFLIFGRAAILGVTSQGNPSSCRYAYPECPRDPDRLVDYLNNHNGGFFRFFNGLDQQQPGNLNFPQEEPGDYDQVDQNDQNYNQNYNNDQNQFYNRPGQKYPEYSYDKYNERPDNFNHPNKRKPGSNTRFPNRYESRILNVNSTEENEARIQNKPAIYSNQDLYIAQSYRYPKVYSENGNVLKFPEAATNYNPIVVPNLIPDQYDPYTQNHLKFPPDDKENKRIKSLFFPGQENVGQNEFVYYPKPLPFYDHSKMIFPDRTGTGNLKFDSEKLYYTTQRPDIGNKYTNYYSKPNYSVGKPSNYHRDQQSSGTKYVYIVRGNGDPNHPEKVPIEYARQARVNEDIEVLEVDDKDGQSEGGSSWKFPNPYQGQVYDS